MAEKITSEQILLVQQILAHDSGVLSSPELEVRNPNMEVKTLQQHVSQLVDDGMLSVEEVSSQSDDLPSQFYAVTKRGIDRLQQWGIYSEVAIWNQVYGAVEVPPALQEIEEMDRPTPKWYSQYD